MVISLKSSRSKPSSLALDDAAAVLEMTIECQWLASDQLSGLGS